MDLYSTLGGLALINSVLALFVARHVINEGAWERVEGSMRNQNYTEDESDISDDEEKKPRIRRRRTSDAKNVVVQEFASKPENTKELENVTNENVLVNASVGGKRKKHRRHSHDVRHSKHAVSNK